MSTVVIPTRAIGDRPISLALHLRRAVDLLLDTTTAETYNWSNCGSCNCGMLARVVTGMEAKTVLNEVVARWRRHFQSSNMFHPPSGWGSMQTVVPEDATGIRATLLAAGMLPTDFEHLELLNDPSLAKPGWDLTRRWGTMGRDTHFQIADNAAFYLLAWSRAIEAFHAAVASAAAIEVPATSALSPLSSAILEPAIS